jgi:hypothetical protein
MNRVIRRGRFIAPTADLSALGGCSDIPIKKLIYIIAPTADLSALDGFPDTQMKKLGTSEN